MKRQLDRVFQPNAIAVIGASNKEEKVGFRVFQNLLQFGFKGSLFPVNLKDTDIQGVNAYKRLRLINDPIDLAIIATPAYTVLRLVKECGEKGVAGVVILSAGFKEAGKIGEITLEAVALLAEMYQMQILGPNSLGFIHTQARVNACFAKTPINTGKIALIAQSGALATSILDWAASENVGFSFFISTGNMLNLGFHDLIDYLMTDPQTACILIYMEHLSEARRFMSAARAFARSKPIIVLKAGESLEGEAAALLHTGKITGSDAVYSAAFQRAGILRVHRIAQLFHCAQAFSMQPRPKGNRLAIVTNTGAAGILATDYLIRNGGQLAIFSEHTIAQLKPLTTSLWANHHPIDITGGATAEDFAQALIACGKEVNVDGIMIIFSPQYNIDATEVADAVVQAAKQLHKTILAVWMGGDSVEEGRRCLEQGNIPAYHYPESAIDVFVQLFTYSKNLELLYETPPDIPETFLRDYEGVKNLIDHALEENRNQLNEIEGRKVLTCYDIPVAPHFVVHHLEQATKVATQLGFPVAMKIIATSVYHKSDFGGVILSIYTEEEVVSAYETLTKNFTQQFPDSTFEGVLVEKMSKKRYELFVGGKKDPTFGPAIIFGKGGVTVEVFKDLGIGLPPLNMALAQRILEQTYSYQVLKGYRHYPPVDLENLKFILCKFAYLMMDFPEIQELEINPLALDETGAVSLDIKILLDDKLPTKPFLNYNHLVISPYPTHYIKPIQLKNGQMALLRPIKPEDEALEIELFDYLSENTVYFRFLGYKPKLTRELVTRFTHIDYDREIAIVAEVEQADRKRLVGVVRVIADAWNEAAEYAIVVADDFQGQGLGRILTDYILDIAKERGIKKIFASTLASNHRMLQMFKARGFKVEQEDYQTYYVEKVL